MGSANYRAVGSVETLEIAYPSAMKGSHPVHIHLSQFQVVDRWQLASDLYLEAWNAAFGTGPAPVPANARSMSIAQTMAVIGLPETQ